MSDEAAEPPPADLSHAGAIVDKAIEYMMSQNIGALAIASALLGGSLALLARGMDGHGIVAILEKAIASVEAGALHPSSGTEAQAAPLA